MNPRRRRKTSRPAPSSRRPAARTLHCEPLEDRRMLANLTAVDAYLVDSTGARVTEVVVGQKVGVRLDWKIKDLPANIANYQVEFRVDGVPLRSDDVTYGAGHTTQSYWWYRTGWYASPGVHNVEVLLDVDSEVPENDEADNAFTFSFTPVTADFPQRMIWPVPLEPFTEIFWSNYNDVDPTAGESDYLGGNATYDGHNAIDTRLTTYSVQDQGVPIYAALDGVVVAINDGEFDRQNEWDGANANYVILDHGNGWQTIYLHMRRDSVQVQVGQTIAQGDRLGLIGSSGDSTAPHLHFEVRYCGLPIETYYDPATYWLDPELYVFDDAYLVASGITNYTSSIQFWEGLSNATVVAQQSGVRLFARGFFSGLQFADQIQAVWRRPNGTTYATRTITLDDDYSRSGWTWGGVNLPTTPDLGFWTVQYSINGLPAGQEFFLVTPQGEPEIRVEHTGLQIVVDGRFTPIDFGAANVGAAAPTRTFNVINHGYAPLTVANLELPAGFTLVEGLAASIAPGAFDTFTVALDTTAGGYVGGEIKITTNDADEPITNYAVEGIVQSPGMGALIVGISEFEIREGGRIVANIRRTGSTASPVTVTLATDDATELALPPTVSFLAGSDYAQFFIEAPSDLSLDGLQQAAVIATAGGYHPGRKTIGVVDDGRQRGDFDFDGLVTGNDVLLWQRGLSHRPHDPLDLADWRQYFGGAPPLVVARVTAETFLASQAAVEEQQEQSDQHLYDLRFSAPSTTACPPSSTASDAIQFDAVESMRFETAGAIPPAVSEATGKRAWLRIKAATKPGLELSEADLHRANVDAAFDDLGGKSTAHRGKGMDRG